MEEKNTTPFKFIYDRFLAKITDDLYLELTREETERDIRAIFESAISNFQFPRFALYNYDLDYEYIDEEFGTVESIGRYNVALTYEEIDIITDCMLIEWIRRQIDSVEVTRMKYSGSDFKFTSQASHLKTLVATKNDMERTNIRKQRMYKRRKLNEDGLYTPNYSQFSGGALNGRKN